MATVETTTGPFLTALGEAFKDFDHDAEVLVVHVGDEVVSLAEGYAPHGATGVLEGSISATAGRTAEGPYVDVGTSDPVGFYQEFGTSKMRAHPFMRPALAQVGAVLRAASGVGGFRGGSAFRKQIVARRRLRRPLITGRRRR